jgi:hypothetical protein
MLTSKTLFVQPEEAIPAWTPELLKWHEGVTR